MKPSIYRRLRRRPAFNEAANAGKENKQEQSFFGEALHEPFFKPVTAMQQAATVQRKCADCEKEDKVQRAPEKKEEEKKVMKKEDKKEEEKVMKKEEEKLMKKDAGENVSAPVTISYVSSLNSKGASLPNAAQEFFSQRMGYDFSNVKIHTDKEAAASAKAVNAKAYAVGNHVVFNEGQFNNESTEGKKLMAHELAHVMQQDNKEIKSNVQRKPDANHEPQQDVLPFIHLEVEGSKIQNTTHNADCNGVSVSGNTSANYSSSGTLAGRPTKATDCSGCAGADCVTVNSTVTSRFRTAPVVSLPAVPGGLNACERRAVRAFINGTLNQHEQQHVAAFNTYRGTVSSPISFTGCRADLQAEVQNIHDNVEVPRRQASDDLSAALDANGANVFNITCTCPDPAP